jgi:tetratricopeptide (TPR) repeat protein
MTRLSVLCVVLSLLFAKSAIASDLDSLLHVVGTQTDTAKVFTFIRISDRYFLSNPAESGKYANKALNEADRIKFEFGRIQALNVLANLEYQAGRFTEALKKQFDVLALLDASTDPIGVATSQNSIALIYQELKDFPKAIAYYISAKKMFLDEGDSLSLVTTLLNLGECYMRRSQKFLDSALLYETQALSIANIIKDDTDKGIIYVNLGNIFEQQNNYIVAHGYFLQSISYSEKLGDNASLCEGHLGIARLIKDTAYARAIQHAEKAYAYASGSFPLGSYKSSLFLS